MPMQPDHSAWPRPDRADAALDGDARTPPRKPHIVIADDDDDVRDTLVSMFVCDGFDVTAAANGDALVRVLDDARRRGADPDLLLLDHRMPCYSGLEVLDGLRAWGFAKPTLLITAFGEMAGEARALGAEVLEKPFEPD